MQLSSGIAQGSQGPHPSFWIFYEFQRCVIYTLLLFYHTLYIWYVYAVKDRLHSQHNAERINAALSMYIDHDSQKKVEFANLNSEQFIY